MSENAKLDALILENIGDIEASIARAVEHLDVLLWEEMASSAETVLKQHDWLGAYDGADEDISFAPREWHSEDEDADAQFFFSIDEIPGPAGDSPYTWVAEALASNPQGASLGLYFSQDVLTPKRKIDRVFNENSELIQQIQDCGFVFQDRKIYIPFRLIAEDLTKAYAEEDFITALLPLTFAISKALENRQSFDELVKAFREAAEN